MKDIIAEFQNVSIDYEMKRITLHACTDISMKLPRGKITALVGESGSGKTTLASALLNCITSPGRVSSGKVLLHSEKNNQTIDVTELSVTELNLFRWNNVSMVFQGAQSVLNPIVTIFNQFYETLVVHGVNLSKKEARVRFVELLERLNLRPDVLDAYPHEISGGMKQRVMIAFSMLLDPEIIILDEPTTALDVITQSYIFSLLKEINKEKGTTMLLLTHDIAVVAEYADYMGIMYGGRIMEFGTVEDVFNYKYNPYTRGLINSTPSIIRDNSEIKPIPGIPIDITSLPEGCGFAERCNKCMAICKERVPSDIFMGKDHFVKCHIYSKGDE
ncbi:MAG: ABC transporter ATP-binding protein [Acholeplasmataceae bacterium]